MWIITHIKDVFSYSCAIALGLYLFMKYSKWQAPVALGGIIFTVYIASILVTLLSGIYYIIQSFI